MYYVSNLETGNQTLWVDDTDEAREIMTACIRYGRIGSTEEESARVVNVAQKLRSRRLTSGDSLPGVSFQDDELSYIEDNLLSAALDRNDKRPHRLGAQLLIARADVYYINPSEQPALPVEHAMASGQEHDVAA